MRELEFLPGWYPQLHRRQRQIMLQVYLTVAVSAGLALWLFLVDRNHHVASQTLGVLHAQVNQADAQLREINRLTTLETQLRKQEEVQSKLGLHVESARIIGTLASIMPENMSLVALNAETEEIPRDIGGMGKAALSAGAGVPTDRRLKVRLSGIAPTDVDVANFITELNRISFFDHVTMTYAKDRREADHLMREFELTFIVNLNMPAGA